MVEQKKEQRKFRGWRIGDFETVNSELLLAILNNAEKRLGSDGSSYESWKQLIRAHYKLNSFTQGNILVGKVEKIFSLDSIRLEELMEQVNKP